jgi:hypothetical protein
LKNIEELSWSICQKKSLENRLNSNGKLLEMME